MDNLSRLLRAAAAGATAASSSAEDCVIIPRRTNVLNHMPRQHRMWRRHTYPSPPLSCWNEFHFLPSTRDNNSKMSRSHDLSRGPELRGCMSLPKHFIDRRKCHALIHDSWRQRVSLRFKCCSLYINSDHWCASHRQSTAYGVVYWFPFLLCCWFLNIKCRIIYSMYCKYEALCITMKVLVIFHAKI